MFWLSIDKHWATGIWAKIGVWLLTKTSDEFTFFAILSAKLNNLFCDICDEMSRIYLFCKQNAGFEFRATGYGYKILGKNWVIFSIKMATIWHLFIQNLNLGPLKN